MDEIHFYCAVCGESLSALHGSAGGFGECPQCLRVIPIPGFPARPGEPADCAGVFPPHILGIEIKFLCDACGNKIQVDARRQGLTLDCPVCHRPTKVPAWGSAPPPGTRREVLTRPAGPLVRLSAEECEFLSAPMPDGGRGLIHAGGP